VSGSVEYEVQQPRWVLVIHGPLVVSLSENMGETHKKAYVDLA